MMQRIFGLFFTKFNNTCDQRHFCFFPHTFSFLLSTMGAHFSEMQDDGRGILTDGLYRILRIILGNLNDPVDFEEYGLRASFIIAHVYSSHSQVDGGNYQSEAFFVRNPTLDGLVDVVLYIPYENIIQLNSLFGREITEQIKRDVLRLWMTYLLNNILTDEQATSERVEECRWMLAHDIVRRVCEGEIAS